jgi:hypothetical protein
MDPNTRALVMGSAGGGSAANVYVEDVFNTYLYTGTGSTPQTLTTGVNLADNNGMVMYRARAGSFPLGTYTQAALFSDFCFGTKYARGPQDNTGNPFSSSTAIDTWTTSGVTLDYDYDQYNRTGNLYVAYTFRNADKFFQAYDGPVYTYSSTVTVAFPKIGAIGAVLVQGRDAISGLSYLYVWHRSLAAGNLLKLNTSGAQFSSSFISVSGADVTLDPLAINPSGTFGAAAVYAFAHDAGGYGASGTDSIVKCGSVTTSSFAATVNLGWEPQWLLIKASDRTENWKLVDNMRGLNAGSFPLNLNINNANLEAGGSIARINSTGFLVDGEVASNTYVYIAIRRGPMKTPTDATKVFNPVTYTGTGSNSRIYTGAGFPIDAALINDRLRISGFTDGIVDRMRGSTFFYQTTSTSAENTGGNYFASALDSMDGYKGGASDSVGLNTSGLAIVNYYFRRAPGFFDVVAYTGTGSARTVSHNLGVTPELMIVKKRSATDAWVVYANNDNTDYLVLNTTAATVDDNTIWNDTSPTSYVFTVGTNDDVNGSTATFIAYLFATCQGVSKVGSYTGTGTTLQINCGFTAGARFVLIKRTDSTGDWYTWDTTRGIISGNDPYLLLNSSAAEVTNTDYIDPYSAGFEISSTAPAAINANGGNFIFLAIA